MIRKILLIIAGLIFIQATSVLYAAAMPIEDFLKKGRLAEARDYLDSDEFSRLPSNIRNYYLGMLHTDGNISARYLKESLYADEDFQQKDYADLQLAHYYFAKGFYITTINNLEIFINKNPKSDLIEEANYLLGMSYLNTGKFEKAQASFSRIIDSQSHSDFYWWASFEIGCGYFQKGDYKGAIKRFERLLDNHSQPAYPQALVMLSHSHKKLGNSQAATEYQESYNSAYPAGFWSGKMLEATQIESDIPSPVIDRKSEKIVNARYYIQVGAFSSRANANLMKTRLSKRGYRVAVESKTENKQNFHKVLVGPYITNASAQAAKEKLEREENDNFLIIIK